MDIGIHMDEAICHSVEKRNPEKQIAFIIKDIGAEAGAEADRFRVAVSVMLDSIRHPGVEEGEGAREEIGRL